MNLATRSVTVRVPASSANLGPGFDAFGLALSLYDELEVTVTGDDLVVDVEGEGANDVPRDANHLIFRSLAKVLELHNVDAPGLRLRSRNRIAHSRGLGSSSAAIVAGIAAGRALLGDLGSDFTDADAFQLAADIEGHPDNVAAAQFGGFTLAWTEGGAARVARLDADVAVTAFVPAEPVPTALARDLLPDDVPHADAATNAGRAALMVVAMTRDPGLLMSATEDRLHQSQRSSAMPASLRLLRTLRLEGVPAVISGAGPTVLAFGHGLHDRVPEGWAHHALRTDPDGVRVLGS